MDQFTHSQLPRAERYPKYYQNTDGSEQIKIISRRSYIYACFYENGDLYTVQAAHRQNSEYTEDQIHLNYRESDEDEFLVLLHRISAYFIRIQETLPKIILPQTA